MNNNLLLQKSINFPKQYINFLNFIHPHFEIIDSIDNYDNPKPYGIIYTGTYTDDIKDQLNKITKNWIIVNSCHYDVDLTTNDELIKNLLPLLYVQLKSLDKNFIDKLYSIAYESLLEKIKYSLIYNTKLNFDANDKSVYILFNAIIATPDVLNNVYFNTVNKDNVLQVASSVLTFLSKVQQNNIKGTSVHYARLITQSNKRYSKKIKSAIARYVKSNISNKELALYQLLVDLNKTR